MRNMSETVHWAKFWMYIKKGVRKMIKAGIIGATGYAGNEMVRLLLGHKNVEIKWLWFQKLH